MAPDEALLRMKTPKEPKSPRNAPAKAKPSSNASTNGATQSAFDVWLNRGLHKLFDEVANEPIPPELLQLIENDRHKVEDDKAS